MEIAAILLLGLAVGGILGWFFRSASTGAEFAVMRQRAEQAEQASRARDAALAELREDAKRALADAFSALSAAALKSNSEEFLKLAHTSVAPIKEVLGKFEGKLQAL